MNEYNLNNQHLGNQNIIDGELYSYQTKEDNNYISNTTDEVPIHKINIPKYAKISVNKSTRKI